MDNYKAHIYINTLTNRVWYPDYNKGIFFIEDWVIDYISIDILESNNIKYRIIEELEHHTQISIVVNISEIESSIRDDKINQIIN